MHRSDVDVLPRGQRCNAQRSQTRCATVSLEGREHSRQLTLLVLQTGERTVASN